MSPTKLIRRCEALTRAMTEDCRQLDRFRQDRLVWSDSLSLDANGILSASIAPNGKMTTMWTIPIVHNVVTRNLADIDGRLKRYRPSRLFSKVLKPVD